MVIRFVLFSLLSASLLTGCGFHLRGKVEIPPELSSMHVQGTKDRQLVTRIEQALRQNGVNVVSGADGAKAVLNITNAKSTRTVSTLDARGKATGYVLNYLVTYSVIAKDGKSLLKPSSVSLRRDFNFDSTQVLQKEGEAKFLINDMRDEATQRILSKLGRINRVQASNSIRQFG